MSNAIWYIKQLFPLKYTSKYRTPDGIQRNATWRMWFGHVFAVAHYPELRIM